MFKNWVIDATMGYPFCFCPIEGDLDGEYSIVVGMNVISDKPPHAGKLVAVIHENGQEAVDEFYSSHRVEIDTLLGKTPA